MGCIVHGAHRQREQCAAVPFEIAAAERATSPACHNDDLSIQVLTYAKGNCCFPHGLLAAAPVTPQMTDHV